MPIKVHLPAESRHVHLKASERGKPYWSPPRRSNDSGEIATDTACIRGQSSPGDSSLASSRASDQSAPSFVDTYVAVFQEQLLLGQHSPPGFAMPPPKTNVALPSWLEQKLFIPAQAALSVSFDMFIRGAGAPAAPRQCSASGAHNGIWPLCARAAAVKIAVPSRVWWCTRYLRL